MKKVLFVFVAVISMLAMTSCVDKEQCVTSVRDKGKGLEIW